VLCIHVCGQQIKPHKLQGAVPLKHTTQAGKPVQSASLLFMAPK
jgi:hypothetical protein